MAAPSRRTRKAKAPPPRGLLDAILTLLLLYGVYASTPLGALGVGAYRWISGSASGVDPFVTFRLSQRGRSHGLGGAQGDPKAPIPPEVADAAALGGVPPHLLYAIARAGGGCEASPCTVQGPLFLGDSEAPGPFALEDVALALARKEGAFGDWVLGAEALFIGDATLKPALARAKASGTPGAELDPLSHGVLLPPMTRAGPLVRAWAAIELYQSFVFAWPVGKGVRISSPFGDRVHPVLGTTRFHNGIDLAVPTGTPILAPGRGRVRRVGEDGICGRYLKVDHGFGKETTYCHLSAHKVALNDWVRRGDVIGLSGATGRVTGPHLHYILRVEGEVVDPIPLSNQP